MTKKQQNQRVVVIDDDPEVRENICDILAAAGFVPEAANGGTTGLKMLDRGPLPCAVVLDLQMPDLTGEQVLNVIRVRYPALIVVIESGAITPNRANSLVGAAAVLQKMEFATALIPLLNRLLAD